MLRRNTCCFIRRKVSGQNYCSSITIATYGEEEESDENTYSCRLCVLVYGLKANSEKKFLNSNLSTEKERRVTRAG